MEIAVCQLAWFHFRIKSFSANTLNAKTLSQCELFWSAGSGREHGHGAREAHNTQLLSAAARLLFLTSSTTEFQPAAGTVFAIIPLDYTLT